MVDFLETGTILPPLLEQQISPPYRIIAHHLDYLQKWREYLLWMWTGGLDKNADRMEIQQSIDELISIILLMDFVGQSYPTAIPAVEEVLKIVNKPVAFDLCETVYDRVSCKLLKAVFSPEHLKGPRITINPKKDIELSSLTNISKAVKTLYSSRMPITLLSDFYQLCLYCPVAGRTICKKGSGLRDKGIYYTPAPLVDYLVFHTFKKAFNKLEPAQIEHLRILDPSCGCGAFLITSLRFILRWLKNKYNNDRKSLYLCPQKSLELLKSMIYGIDIDDGAIRWTRRLLLLTVWDFCINNGVSKNDIQNLRIPTLEENVVCMDFLKEQSLKNETFHVIIGGPPFVRVQELYKTNPTQVNNYKQRFRTAETGQFDLYMLFIEKAIELLAKQGYLSMSVSNTFLRSESGRALRNLIAEKCAVNEIVEFQDSKLYPKALVQVAAITLQKTDEKSVTRHVFVKGKGSLRRKLSGIDKQDGNTFLELRNLPPTACASENWGLKSQGETNLLYRIESVGIPLAKLPVQVRFGAASGADNVFMLKNAEYLDSETVSAEGCFGEDVFESSILRPMLRGRHIKGYIAPKPETLCIFPYDETGNLIAEDVLQIEFPRTYRYLKSCQSYLASRKLKGSQKWYAFRNEDVSGVIQSPKVISSVVNSGSSFTLDQHQHLFCNNSVILVCPDEKVINPYFLLAVLNSKVFWIWAQHRMPTLGLGWYSYRVNVLRKFPVPTLLRAQDNQLLEDIANFAAKLLNEEISETDRVNVLSAIDNMVSKLYGISQDELSQYDRIILGTVE